MEKEKEQIFSFRSIPVIQEVNLKHLNKEINSEYEKLII